MVTTGVQAPADEPTVDTVMTRCPLGVPLDAPFHAVAAMLAGGRISAVPVLDARGRPVGVVSEVDLIRASGDHDLSRVVAADLMSCPVWTVDVGDSLSSATRLLAENGVRRLFVVDKGLLVGVVARRDVLASYLRDDADIRAEIERTVLRGRLGTVRVSVRDGVALLLGRVEWRSELAGLGERVRAVPGVVDVCERVRFLWDDGARRSSR